MSAPDLLALHEAMKHYAYEQAQLHPLNSNAWLQFPYYAYGFTVLSVGGFIGWWLRGLARRAESVLLHEHKGMKFERHHSGRWLQHLHDEQTGELASLRVYDGKPPGTEPPAEVVLTSPNQRLKRAR